MAARFDLVLAADVLYEFRNVEPLLERWRSGSRRAPRPRRRPYEDTFLRQWSGEVEQVAERVIRLTRAPG